ncbi:MAG: cytochrome c [Deltaproteobacteria bacterium]|nr:MAG: cytochrome c [Deltaproteobacteria bacterium]
MENRRNRLNLNRILLIGIILCLSLVFAGLGLCQEPPKKTPALLSKGKQLYEQACTPCHGPKGDGNGQLATSLKTKPGDFTRPLKQWPYSKGDLRKIFDAITNGVPDTAMAKFRYSEEERWALVYTVMEFGKEKGK